MNDAGEADGGFEPRHGWANQAWVGSRFVVRVSSGRFRDSFAHEARVVALLDGTGVPVAPVVAHGRLADLEGEAGTFGADWVISRRRPGRTLASWWPDLDPSSRRRVGVSLGRVLRRLHDVDLGDLAPPWWLDALKPPCFHNAYHPPVALGPALADAAHELPHADSALLDDVAALLAERMALFTGDKLVFAHCDPHGHNVMVDVTSEPSVSALLDWEGAHPAPADTELDMLLRWAANADDMPERAGGPNRISAGDVIELAGHVATGYPELFAVPRLRDRLEVYEVHWQLVQLFFDRYWRALHPVEETGPPREWERLRALLDGRSHLQRFGVS